jgi:hypothetical protein
VRRDAKLGEDYAGSPLPGQDPEAARASSVVQQMQAARRAVKATSFKDIILRRAG